MSDGLRRNLPHWRLVGSTYFVTFCTKDRRILSPQERSLVFEHVRSGDPRFYLLVAGIVMPDHVHLDLGPARDVSLDRILKGIKGVSARRINEAARSRGSVWQEETYDRILRDDAELAQKAEYLVENPVRAGLVASAAEWPWSILRKDLLA